MKTLVPGLIFVWAAVHCLQGATPGDEVIVVYNSRVPVSKAVAEFYAQQRQVPKNQVLGFDLTSSEDVSRAEFRHSLQKPLAKGLSSKKLWRIDSITVNPHNGQPSRTERMVVESRIRYAVLCYG